VLPAKVNVTTDFADPVTAANCGINGLPLPAGSKTVTIACYVCRLAGFTGDTNLECDELAQPRNEPEDFDDDESGDEFDDDIADEPRSAERATGLIRTV
jgi:hypothetical protein